MGEVVVTKRRKSQIVWASLIIGTPLVWLIVFSIFEPLGLASDDVKSGWITLSRDVWEIQQAWPLFFPLVFYLAGSLQWGFAVHILWRWTPQNPNDHNG